MKPPVSKLQPSRQNVSLQAALTRLSTELLTNVPATSAMMVLPPDFKGQPSLAHPVVPFQTTLARGYVTIPYTMTAPAGIPAAVPFVEAGAMLALSILLLLRKNYKFYPAFLCYIWAAFWQSIQFDLLVRHEGNAWPLGWITQIVVLALRALAVLELCRNVLANFRGIWTLARAVLLFSAAVVTLSYGVTARLRDHALTPLSVDIGARLGVAVAIVVLLAFARYYRVNPAPAHRLLAVSFCVYSCLSVINDIFLQSWARSYSSAWALTNVLGLTAMALPWLYARFQKAPQPAAQPPSCLDKTVYHTLSPRINSRLRLLNRHLAEFYRPEAPRS